MSINTNEEEFEKRFDAQLLTNTPFIYIDNIPEGVALAGSFLETFVTADSKHVRVLGEGRTVVVPNACLIAATGNNLRVGNDSTRRALVSYLTTDTETPFLKTFPFDPPVEAKRRRVEIVTAINTFLLHHYQNPGKGEELPFASFEQYSSTIRAALISAGEPDPVETTLDTRNIDPKRETLAEIMELWWPAFFDFELTVREALTEASANIEATDEEGRVGLVAKHPDLRKALWKIAGNDQDWDAKKLGRWLEANRMIVGGLRFEPGEMEGHVKVRYWRLAKVGGGGEVRRWSQRNKPSEPPTAAQGKLDLT
jgi:hypothetical protein